VVLVLLLELVQLVPSVLLLTGSTSGVTIQYSGTSYTDCENQLVALIRSRGTINSSTEFSI
jgi:hypothetical protein